MLTDAYVAFPEFDIVTAVVSILQGNPSRLHPAEMNAIENAAPGTCAGIRRRPAGCPSGSG